ncbi:MAG TPA: chemotaxis protein CheA [Candidatus Sulfotelmatobacter sp.]|jgi:two-component system chemotaxis sensor kinase CheA
MDEIVKDFLIESGENLDRLDQELVKLESEPSSKELLDSVFRTIHTIKGTCGFLGFTRLEKLTHAGENLLSRLRDGEIGLNAKVTSGLLAMVDGVRQMLAAIQDSGHDGEENYAPLIAALGRLQVEQAVGAMPEADAARVTAGDNSGEIRILPAGEPDCRLGPQESTERPGQIAARGPIAPVVVEPAVSGQQAPESRNPEPGNPESGNSESRNPESGNPESSVETIRVAVTLLDRLMNLVGELVLARNQLLQLSGRSQDAGFQAVAQRMNLIATELQGEVMKTRMQPIGNIWNKFPRTVRDLALSCGKEVRLEMEGQDTELDRTIIEAIKDPLTHLVRNSVDHGVECAAVRRRAGKDAAGLLKLRAFHEGGQVNIEISDDGAGLDVDRIRQKAIERGLIPKPAASNQTSAQASAQASAQVSGMAERDVFNLIFLPGFSTAEKVSNVSGRGVGMDVVKTNVEKIGGTVDIQSTPGRGTSVRVKIPLTLAIIPALIVTCGGERFAIPQVSLSELVRLDAEERETKIELVHGAPVYRLRGRLLPLVYLDRELGIGQGEQEASSPAAINIVVLQAEEQQFGLIVDEITDTEEIVVKPLGKQLKGISAYAGATIMGDGRVALILDVPGLAQKARVIAEGQEFGHDEGRCGAAAQAFREEHALLLAGNGIEGRVAIPLSMVARLEEFPKSVVELAAAQEVMQYRGQIVPLVRLSQIFPSSSEAEMQEPDRSIQVVVYSEGKHTVGLIVDRIIDIVEERAMVESLTPRAGIVGSFVTQRHVTDLLDLPAIVRAAVPGLLDGLDSQAGGI